MPTSRKSSIGAARRGLQKEHRPYRGDDPTVGKKTGVKIRQVERKSDGFEPFDELMEQVDKRTPPMLKVAKKRKSSVPAPEIESDDEFGEISMEIDTPRQPRHYFANSRQQATPSNNRNVARISDIDFDRIPSPRSARKPAGPGPSRLSSSFRADEPQDDSDEDNDPGYGYDDYGNEPGDSGERDSPGPQAVSFQEMDQDDDEQQDLEQPDEEEPEEEAPPPPSKRDKGKGRATLPDVPEERESDIEAEIAQGLEDVREQTYSEDEVEQEPEPSPKRAKKGKTEKQPKVERPKTARVKKENRQYREGVRKSARERYEPLEWWRGEKLVYGRNQGSSGVVLAAPVKEIVRIPKEIPEPLGKRKRSRARSKTVEEVRYKVVEVENPEEGWDDDTDEYGTIIDFDSKEEVEKRIACISKNFKPNRVIDPGWKFLRALSDSEFIAAGLIILPPEMKKPTKQTKDNTYIFYIIAGAVTLRIHDSSRLLSTGAMFMIPRGNSYYIENASQRETKLFFTQARKVVEDIPPSIAPPRRSSVAAVSVGRSSSAGAATGDAKPAPGVPTVKRAMSMR